MRLRKTLKTLFGILGALFIIIVVWLFLIFPRVVNQLADLLGNMGFADNPLNVELGLGVQHVVVAMIITLIIAFFFIWRPVRDLRETLDAPGLMIRKGEGVAFIDPESVRLQIMNAIGKVGDIHRADVNVENDAGRALIRISIVTDILMNGPQKKNEINREVRKIVQDQLGIDIHGKPTISFSLTPLVPETPLITSGSVSVVPPVSVTSRTEPVIERPPISSTSVPIPAEDEPDIEPVEYRPAGPSGIDLARSDPFAKTSATLPGIDSIDTPSLIPSTPPIDQPDEDRDQLASQG